MKKPTKMQMLKLVEDRIIDNTGAVYDQVKDVAAALYLLGHDRASDRLTRANNLLSFARHDFHGIRRTKANPRCDPDSRQIERLRRIESAARDWSNAIAERRSANITPNHPDFKRYRARITSAGANLRASLAER